MAMISNEDLINIISNALSAEIDEILIHQMYPNGIHLDI